MEKIRLGLIGLGYIGKIHLRHCQKLANAKLVATSDLSQKALKDANDAGVKKTYTNYEQLLKDPTVDAVIIALPTHLHTQCAKQAAEAKKHIFLEKPIARNTTEAKEIVLAARKNNVKLMMGYPLRFNPVFCKVKERINDGILGEIEISHATFITTGPFIHRAEVHTPLPVPEWWFDKKLTGGGALIDLGSHLINLLRWYFGEITSVKSHLGYRFNLDFEDSATCITKFEHGTLALINVGWFSQGYHLKVDLHGSVRSLSADHSPSNPISKIIQILTKGYSKFYEGHFIELQHFVNCLIKDQSPSPSGEDGLRDLEVIEQAYKNQIRLD
jgi:UDP-N-acetylglucosamine 3-dehydrogenase